jgi:hypothetical protein
LHEHLLHASPDKCSFYSDRVLFFGFNISAEGITMEHNKLSTILDWPYPKNGKDLNCFLGFLKFYCKFINGFSKVAAPLTDLTKENVNVEEGLNTAESRLSFNHCKECFKSAPLLSHFDFDKPRIF